MRAAAAPSRCARRACRGHPNPHPAPQPKPFPAAGLSYTQHLWEGLLVDFALEVMGAQPFVAVGNSIGGGLAAGLASNLRTLCRGLVLCNSAGR